MADFYYLYDPADNLALAQSIHLANTDGGMSYIIPYANKSGVVDTNDPASYGTWTIESYIDSDPANGQLTNPRASRDPISNRLSPGEFAGEIGQTNWNAIKEMVKTSITQASPAGWSEASLEAADTTYSVIGDIAYPELQTQLWDQGSWHSADTSAQARGNPAVAYGGKITTALFVDLSGHYLSTPDVTGEKVISPSGLVNSGTLYKPRSGEVVTATDKNSRTHGLAIDASNEHVTIANFSVTSQGFGTTAGTNDAVRFAYPGVTAAGTPLSVISGNVTITGDVVIDQVVQVTDGTIPYRAPFAISGPNSHVTIDKARIFLGSVRGYESMIGVSSNATLELKDSTVYGFSSSNSNAPLQYGGGLDWADFELATGSATIAHLLSADNGGSVKLNGTAFQREDARMATGDYSEIAASMGIHTTWEANDYKNSSYGDLFLGSNGSLEIINSSVIGSIVSNGLANSLLVKDSVVAGAPVGRLTGGSLVQLGGGNIAIENSLIDSLDATLLPAGNLSLDKTSHVLATSSPWIVPTTKDPTYSSLPSFANTSTQQLLQAWGDNDSGAASKVTFQYQGPTGVTQNPAGISLTLSAQLREESAPQYGISGTTFFLSARFQEPVTGFDATDLENALGASAISAGWKVVTAPITRDGGKNWSFQLLSPASFASPVPLQLAAGAANANLVTGLASDASNTFTLSPVGTGSGGGGSGGGSSSGGSGGASAQPPSTPGTGNSSTPGLDNDNLDESPENHNGLVIDANKDGIPDASQSNVAGIKRVGDGTSQGDFAALAVGPNYTLNAVTLRPIVNNQVNVSLPSGGSLDVPIPQGINALLEPLEFFVEGVTPGATIEAELFIPDNFNEQTDAYMRFNYQTQRFEEYVDANGQKLYQLLDENGDGKVDRIIFSLTDGDPNWDGDRIPNGVIIDPGSPIDAEIKINGSNKRDHITGNLLANTIRGKGGKDHLDGDLGRDVILGGRGKDYITGGEQGDYLKGGAGKDHFIYRTAADSSAHNPYQRDEIARFNKHDRIDLRHFDANLNEAGHQRFHFIGSHVFSGRTGELRFHAGLLSADLDGDRLADFSVTIDGSLGKHQLLLGS